MKKFICIACFAFYALVGNAQDLKGTWELESVQVIKSSDTKLSKGAKIIPTEIFTGKDKLPEQLIFSEQTVSYINEGSISNSGTYSIEGNKLSVDLAVALEAYSWKMEGGKLVLTVSFERADKNLKVSTYELSGYYKANE